MFWIIFVVYLKLVFVTVCSWQFSDQKLKLHICRNFKIKVEKKQVLQGPMPSVLLESRCNDKGNVSEGMSQSVSSWFSQSVSRSLRRFLTYKDATHLKKKKWKRWKRERVPYLSLPFIRMLSFKSIINSLIFSLLLSLSRSLVLSSILSLSQASYILSYNSQKGK